ncbi:MAG: glycoside hydrolase family 47 protein [Saprospirales bacterium]|nr:glycoside hydrolase family 47 protein [Saprospirales bacterium]
MRTALLIFCICTLFSCDSTEPPQPTPPIGDLATQVKAETQRAWAAYKQYAWGRDVLLPISKGAENWYEEPLYISPIDAYSTLKVMGLDEEAAEIETYIIDSVSFDKDISVKVFEVNIRVLGGLLAMYQYSENEQVLQKAIDFADRILPAFDSPTGVPYYSVNLKTGAVDGKVVNVAEAGTYLLEMGVLSHFSKNPIYYEKAKRATKAIYDRRSSLDLIGQDIDVETGEWTKTTSHICAGIDSYYEYLYKGWLLFGDPELKAIWDTSIVAVHTYLPEMKDSLLWYGRVDMYTGKHVSSVVTLYDAFFPAVLALSGDMVRAEKMQATWNWLWNRYGLEPMAYDYATGKPTYPVYDLNPEIIESAYYLYHFTKDPKYKAMGEKYFADILKYCKTEIAFSAVENVETMEQRDYMATFFFAETMKYFYLLFREDDGFHFDDYIFTTEAHPFKKELLANFNYQAQ